MSAWLKVKTDVLNQGDLLLAVKVPILPDTFPETDGDGTIQISADDSDVIVLSQSCDLENNKLPNVLLAQVFSTAEFEDKNQSYRQKGRWKEVSRGRFEALHLICSPDASEDPKKALVVDFRMIVSLPIGYIQRVAMEAGDRWRLQPPHLEALSHSFGRFFSRVALPDIIKF
jgi:hypothetical protein